MVIPSPVLPGGGGRCIWMEEAKVGQIQEDLTFLQCPELPRFPELSAAPGCSHDGERPLPGTFLASSLLLCWVPAWQGSLETSLYPPSTRCETRSFFWPLVLAGLSLLFGPCHRPPAGSVQAWGTGTPRSRSTSLSPQPHPCPLSCCRSGGPVQTPQGRFVSHTTCLSVEAFVLAVRHPWAATRLHTARHRCQHAPIPRIPESQTQAGRPHTCGSRSPSLSPTRTVDESQAMQTCRGGVVGQESLLRRPRRQADNDPVISSRVHARCTRRNEHTLRREPGR